MFSNLFSIILPNIGKYFPRNSLFKRKLFSSKQTEPKQIRTEIIFLLIMQLPSISLYVQEERRFSHSSKVKLHLLRMQNKEKDEHVHSKRGGEGSVFECRIRWWRWESNIQHHFHRKKDDLQTSPNNCLEILASRISSRDV